MKTYPSPELIAGSSEGVTICPSCGCTVKIEMDLWPYGNFFHSSYNSVDGAEKEHQHAVKEDAPFIKYDEQQIEEIKKKLAKNAVIEIDMLCCHSSITFDRLKFGNICALARVELNLTGEVGFYEFVDHPHLQNLERIVGCEFRAFIYAD